MDAQSTIRKIMKDNGITQAELAGNLGYNSQTAISGILSRADIKASFVVRLLSKLGYEVVVRPRGDQEPKEGEYTLTEE